MEKKLIRKDVYFDLPFIISVKDGFRDGDLDKWFEAYQKGESLPFSRYAPHSNQPSTFVVGGGCPIHIPSDFGDPYLIKLPELEMTFHGNQIRVPENQVELTFLRRINPYNDITFAGEVVGDRNGNYSFSSVIVKIDINVLKPEYCWEMELFADLAIFAVNLFIENYRVIADKSYVRQVTPTEIQKFYLRTLYEDGTVHWAQLGGRSGPFIGFGCSIPNDDDIKIREALVNGTTPPIDEILDIEIRNHMELYEWRLALIESAVLFEAWLSTFLYKKFEDKGLAGSEIDNKFLNSDGYPRSITYVAKNLVLEATDFDFKQSNEYKEWENKVRDPRNEVVHGKVFIIEPEMAIDAYDATKAAIKLLKESDRCI